MFKLEKRTGYKVGLLRTIITFAIAILAAMLVASVLILAIGKNPVTAYLAMFKGAFGSAYRASEVLVRTTPLLLTGLGVAFAFRTGMFNMGAEGQFAVGIIVGTLVMLHVPAGGFAVVLAFLAAAAAGAAYGAIPGFLRAKMNVGEGIVTIMMNFIATLGLSWLLNGPLKDPSGYLPQTALTPESAYLPILLEGTRLHLGFVVAVVVALLAYFVMFYMPVGFQMRATGCNREAAKYSGYKVPFMMVLSMMLSGGLAGLAGVIEVAGLHHRLMEGVSANFGWDAIAVALIGKQNPLGIILSAFLFAALKVGGNAMQSTQGIPSNLVDALQGLVILFALGSDFFIRYNIKYIKKAEGRVAP